MGGAVSDGKSTVQSAAKAFAVLRAFSAEWAELTSTEVARMTGLDRGTSFRLVHSLVSLGYLAAVPATRRFRLTHKCLDLGLMALAGGSLKSMAAPLLREQVPDQADTASLETLEGADVVYVKRGQSDTGRRDLERRVGSRTGAYGAALGHVLLAWLPAEEARGIMNFPDRVALSERTLTDLDTLCARLDDVRHRGYAISDGENAYG